MSSILTNYHEGLSYYHNPGSNRFQIKTIGTLIEEASTKFGKFRKAVIFCQQNVQLTFTEVLEMADKFGAGLLALGLKMGDQVGIWGPNTFHWYISYLGCARAGLIAVCINSAYKTYDLEHNLNVVDLKCIVCPVSFNSHQYYEILCEIVPELKDSQQSPGDLKSQKFPTLKHIILMDSKSTSKVTHTFYEILNGATAVQVAEIQQRQKLIPFESCNSILFSSGISGTPKPVIHTHFQVVNQIYEMKNRFDLNQNRHIVCCQVPFSHVFGNVGALLTCLHTGATLVVPSLIYNPEDNLNALQKEKCTMIYGTPKMYLDLLERCYSSNVDSIKLKIAISSSGATTPELCGRLKKVFTLEKIILAYGLTECGAVFTSLPDEPNISPYDNVGYLMNHLEAKVVDQNNNLVPFGQHGELLVRGYSTTAGYYRDPITTAIMYEENNWFRTGDEFVLYSNGYGSVIGRLHNMIRKGIENIQPTEIEKYLITHSNIADVYVIGVPNLQSGDELCACVKLKSDCTLDLEVLRDFCKNKIASFKIPSYLKIMNDFPKTESGKILRKVLQENVLKEMQLQKEQKDE